MAGSSIIGALRVVLGADTAAFEDGLKHARGQTDSFAKSVTKIASGIGLERGLEKVVEGLVHGLKDAVKSADDLGKTASKVGLPVEELTKLKFAADLSDVSMESLSTGLGKLSKNMVAAATGTKEQRDQFDNLGISVTNADGTLRSVTDVFADLAGKFAGSADGAAKTAAALNLLGKGGKDLIPLLNEGKGGIEEFTKVAERMGLVISKDAAAQSQRFNDNLKLLDLASKGLANTIMAGVLPALVRLSDQFVVSAKEGDTMRSIAERVVGTFKTLVGAVFTLIESYKILSAVAAVAGDVLSPFKDVQKTAADIQILWETLKAAGPAFEGIKEKVDGLFLAITVGGKAMNEMPIGPNKEEMEAFKAFAQKFAQEVAAVWEETRTPAELLEARQARLNAMFEGGAISAETYARAMQLAAEKSGTSWDIAGASIAGSFAKIGQSFGKENKAMATAGKVFGAIQATISMFTGAAKALELPFPANLAAMATVLATGAGLIASLNSTNVPGAAKGGSFMVPGGVSGTDNMMVPLNLASGERVDITPASEVAAGGRFGRGNRTLTVDIDPRSFFGRHMRDFAEAMIEAQRDGYEFQMEPA